MATMTQPQPEISNRKTNDTTEKTNSQNILNEAEIICNEIINDKALAHVARDAGDLMAYAIGSMIATMAKKEIIQNTGKAFSLLRKTAFHDSSKNWKPNQLNRRTTFEILRKSSLFKKDTTIREAKSGGTLPNIKEICEIIGKYENISQKQIESPARTRNIVLARFYTIWVMRTVCGHSLAYIGSKIGNRDHSSILNGVNRIHNMRQNDAGARKTINRICDETDMLALKRHYRILIEQNDIKQINP